MVVERRRGQVGLSAHIAQQLVAEHRVPLDAGKFLVQQAAVVVADIHEHIALAYIVVKAALIGQLTYFNATAADFLHRLAAHDAHEQLGRLFEHLLDEHAGQSGHHHGVDIGRLVGHENIIQQAAAGCSGLGLHLHQLTHGTADHTGVLILGYIVQIPQTAIHHFFGAACHLPPVGRRHLDLVSHQIRHRREVLVDASIAVVLDVGVVDDVQQLFHHLAGRTPSSMEAGRLIKIADTPVLQPCLLALIEHPVAVDGFRRLHHLGGDHRVVVVAQIAQQRLPVHMHRILEFAPRKVRVELVVVRVGDDAHRLVEHLHIFGAFFRRTAWHGHPAVAQTAHDVAFCCLIEGLILRNIACTLLKKAAHLRPVRVDGIVAAPDIEVVERNRFSIQIADDGRLVAPDAGVFQQEAVDLVGDAAVLAAGVVEHLVSKLLQAGNFGTRQLRRRTLEYQLIEDSVVLLHVVEALDGVGLDGLQQLLRFHIRGEFRLGEGADCPEIFNIALESCVHPLSPFSVFSRSAVGRVLFPMIVYYTVFSS